MKRSIIGRADLLEILAENPNTSAAALKSLLGYEWEEQDRTENTESSATHLLSSATITANAQVNSEKSLEPVPFWQAFEYQTITLNESAIKAVRQAISPPKAVSIPAPEYQYLSSWSGLEERLGAAFAPVSNNHRLDMEQIIARLGRGEILPELVYEKHMAWGENLQIIDDRNKHLAPYLTDHKMLQQQLAQLYPEHNLEIAIWDAALAEPLIQADIEYTEYRPPLGGNVLILSDLGCLANDGGRLKQAWRRLGRRLKANKCQAIVLSPYSPQKSAPDLSQLFHIISWEHPLPARLSAEQEKKACQQILDRLAPTWCFSPGLLRSLRLSLGAASAPAYIESLIWQHSANAQNNLTGAALKAEESLLRYHNFNALDNLQQKKVLNQIRAWHYNLPVEIWYATLWNLPEKARAVVDGEELQKAEQFLMHIANRSLAHSNQPLGKNARAWVERNLARLSDSAEHNAALKESIRLLKSAQKRWQTNTPETTHFSGKINLAQHKNQLLFIPSTGSENLYTSPIASLMSGNASISIDILADDQQPTFWTDAIVPPWADCWGHDHYGPWVEFVLGDLRQKMRWIKPGQFIMGSAENEANRFDNEGPQHPITIEPGFWLFDTTVTQALWQAVMETNPCEFKHPNKPIACISWDQCQLFLEKINQQLPGLNLSLPTEAQWEYACRAGTISAYHFGDKISTAQVNFGLSDTLDGAKEVNGYAPNPIGLYQMHGNVWEWCQDIPRKYTSHHMDEPSARFDSAKNNQRAVRGGSWSSLADSCRSATRSQQQPSESHYLIGFRCARTQNHSAQPTNTQTAMAEHSTQQDKKSTRLLLANKTQKLTLTAPLNKASKLAIRSDQQQILLKKITRPTWASAMGRDQYGLWSEFKLHDKSGEIIQRLRWIPPGRFIMGSAKDEAGRYDDEGPQHQVTLENGYWLFDTPVTQALWELIMGKNPSYFQSPLRPVENVSWKECQHFMDVINGIIPGLDLSLPSEAQWEYACRAGTDTALYNGNIEIIGERNAPALDKIAWYGGNSGEDFDLQTGYNSSDWKEKQYPHHLAGTRQVKLKIPNAWGLYDMLGNVWEWTADTWHNSYKNAPNNGLAWQAADPEAERVLRGGSWDFNARDCRSASRVANSPGQHFSIIGFRCARVQAKVRS